MSEVASLTQPQLIPSKGGWLIAVRDRKQRGLRHEPLSQDAAAAIQRWLTARAAHLDGPAIFTGFVDASHRPVPRAITTVRALHVVRKYAARVGIGHVTPHDIRRFVQTAVSAQYGLFAVEWQRGYDRPATIEEMQPGRTDGLY